MNIVLIYVTGVRQLVILLKWPHLFPCPNALNLFSISSYLLSSPSISPHLPLSFLISPLSLPHFFLSLPYFPLSLSYFPHTSSYLPYISLSFLYLLLLINSFYLILDLNPNKQISWFQSWKSWPYLENLSPILHFLNPLFKYGYAYPIITYSKIDGYS